MTALIPICANAALPIFSAPASRELQHDAAEQQLMPRWLLLAAIVIVTDQITKIAVLDHLTLMESRMLLPFFNLVLVMNSGAAFSFLADAGGWQKWFFIVLAIGISGWLLHMLRLHATERLLPAALSLILGGALGNVIDRLRFNAVVDFLDFHYAGYHWPAFNVADSAITIGVALMLFHQYRYGKETP